MMFKKLVPFALLAALFAGSYGRGVAQSAVDGAIGGAVEDQSGASIPKATVTIRDNGTNATQKITADGSGYYRAIHLTPGTYTVTVEAPGFKSSSTSVVNVEVGSLTDPHVRLVIGSAGETVQVTTEAPSVNTTNNEFATVIDQKILADLPVNNYRWSAYALLTPGVVEGGGFGLLSFRGQSTLLNNVTFDGADDNQAFFSEERGRTRVGYSTAKASIQEFQVNTSNYSVEYGRSAGGVVNAVTKSGTNAFHGEAYFFDRDAEFGAENPFTTHAVQTAFAPAPLAFTNQVFKPKDWRKQAGFGIGGPIWKDKIFFFFAFDKFLRNFPGISAPSSPSLFYTTPDTTVATCAGTTTATVDGGVCQLAANINKTTLALITPTQYSAAVTTYTNGIAGLSSITGLTPRTGDQDIFFPKVDWQINSKNHFSVELNRLRWTSPAGIQTSTSALNYGVASFGNDFVKDTFIIGKFDSAITSTLSNEIRYQYGRDFEFETPQTPTSYENTVLDNPAGYKNPYQIPPNVNISNAFQFGTATFLNRPAYPDERRYQIADTVNLVRGHHSFKFGLDYLHTNDLSQNLQYQYAGFNYPGSNYAPYVEYITDLNVTNGCGATHTIECYAASGTTPGYQQGFGPLGFEFQTKDYAGFAQDEWKVSRRVSLTLGVRYEYEQTPSTQIPNLAAEAIQPFTNGSTNKLPDNRTNFGPRIGFAFDVFGNGKTSVRGGYGEFFARIINSAIYNALAQTGNLNGQLQISAGTSAQNIGTSSGSPINAPLFPQIVNPAGFAPNTSALNIVYFDQNFKAPEIHQADITVEQDLGFNTTLGVTWLAAFGRRLQDFEDTNLPAPSTTVSYNVGAGGPIGASTVITLPYYKALNTANGRPDSRYNSETDVFSGVNSNYEAIVFALTHKLTHNLSFSANYTFSHALDYGENNGTFTNTNSLLDPRNLRLEYGNSNQNIPNRVVAYAVYNTPSRFKGIYGYLLNNYEIAPSFSGQNGAPYSAGLSGSFAGVVLNDGTKVGTAGAFGGAASSLGGVNGTGGTARVPGTDRNIFQFRRELLLDLRLSKRFRVMDRVDLELLAETFNLANHLNQTGVASQSAYGSTAGTVAGGVVTSPNILTPNSSFGVFNPQTFSGNANNNFIYTPRQVQFGARIQF